LDVAGVPAVALHGYLLFSSTAGDYGVIEGYTPDGHALKARDASTGIPVDSPMADRDYGDLPGSWVCRLRDFLDTDVGSINNANIGNYSATDWYGPNSSSVLHDLVNTIAPTANYFFPGMGGDPYVGNWYTVP
jgi:hypothetical protein